MAQSQRDFYTFGALRTNRLSVIDHFDIRDTANQHSYNITSSALSRDVSALIPSLTTDDIFLFENANQPLTNKTLTDPSNNIVANSLRSSTGTINISTNTPSAGQVLQATSATNAIWQTQTTDVDKVAYVLASIEVDAISFGFTTVAYFPWLNSRYSVYANGTCVFRTIINNRNLDIKLRDTTNGVDLGSSLSVSATGNYSFSVINPTTDAQVELQVRKTASSGISPIIYGVVLEYTN